MAGLFYHDVFAALTGAGIPFVVVGGVAVNLQGVPRFTADLDVAVALDGAVLRRAAGVLGGLGLRLRLPVRLEELGDTELVRGWVEERLFDDLLVKYFDSEEDPATLELLADQHN